MAIRMCIYHKLFEHMSFINLLNLLMTKKILKGKSVLINMFSYLTLL